MADFNQAIEKTLSHEGGYVDHPDDKGGPTNWGISTRWLRSIGDERDVKTLTRTEAIALYEEHFWDRYSYGTIASQRVAERVFDLCVNANPRAAHRVLQRALRAVGQYVKADGLIGSATLAAVEKAREDVLLAAFRSEMAAYYRLIIAKKPKQKVFRRGWLRRAYEDDK